jgi:hypothetical protein
MQHMFLGFLSLIFASFGIVNANNTKLQPSENIENVVDQKEIQMNHENQIPQYLYKIVSLDIKKECSLKLVR